MQNEQLFIIVYHYDYQMKQSIDVKFVIIFYYQSCCYCEFATCTICLILGTNLIMQEAIENCHAVDYTDFCYASNFSNYLFLRQVR